ncbi:hypothetical protein Tco_0752362 [Tanacetum coccineum]|uniref:Uncharacterized protein n=1 Tax=Tanacetum coccineum TaxID=301880 RepID=A0ABQ4Z7W3_9ASTR
MDHHRRHPYVLYRCPLEEQGPARPSSSHEFPIAPVIAPPGIRHDQMNTYPPPGGDSYLIITHLLPVYSLDLDAPDQAHSGSSTRDVLPRLCYPSRRAPRRSEAFRRWCADPLSTLSPVDSYITHAQYGSLALLVLISHHHLKVFKIYSSKTSIERMPRRTSRLRAMLDIERDHVSTSSSYVPAQEEFFVRFVRIEMMPRGRLRQVGRSYL